MEFALLTPPQPIMEFSIFFFIFLNEGFPHCVHISEYFMSGVNRKNPALEGDGAVEETFHIEQKLDRQLVSQTDERNIFTI